MITCLLLLFVSNLPSTQSAAAPPQSSPVHEFRSHPNWPAARPGDVGSIRGLSRYSSTLSQPPKVEHSTAGASSHCLRRRERVEIPIQASDRTSTDVVFVSPDAYSDMSDTGTKHEGFFDHLIAMRVQQFDIMAHVWASYESRENQNDPRPFVRGIKSFELLNRGGRWYITQVAWVRESKNNPIPALYMQDQPQ